MPLVVDADLEEFVLARLLDERRVDGNGPGPGGRGVVGLPGVAQDLGNDLLKHLVIGVEHQFTQRVVDGHLGGNLGVGLETLNAALQELLQAALGERRVGADHQEAELLDDRDDPRDGILNLLGVFLHLVWLVVIRLDQVEVADDDAEEIVEIVGDALRHGADGRGAARVHESALQGNHLAVDRQKTQLRLHAGERFVQVDGLRDVIDGADAETFDFSLLRCPGGDEDDRDGAGVFRRLQPAAYLDAVHVRHHHVEQDEVGLGLCDEIQRLHSTVSRDDMQALALELALEQLHVDRLIIDDQDGWGGGHTGRKQRGRIAQAQASAQFGVDTPLQYFASAWRPSWVPRRPERG